MVRYSFLVRLSHPLLHAGLSRRILDHLIRPVQHRLRNRETYLFRCLEINRQLELRRLLHGEFGRLGALQNFVNEDCCTFAHIETAWAIGHQAARLRDFPELGD